MKHLFLCCAILAGLLASHTVYAQKYYEKFLELGFIIQQGDKILPTPEGNYVLSGSSVSDLDNIVPRLFVTKLTPQGDTLWLTQIPCEEGYLYFGDMIATEYGYAVVASRIETDSETYYDATIVFIQIDEHGNILNQQDVGTLDYDNVATKIIRTDDNGYLITGYAIPGNYYYPYALRLDSTLSIIWERYYEGFNEFPEVFYPLGTDSLDVAMSDIITNSDGTYYLWGANYNNHSGYQGSILLLQIDAQGQQIWDTTYRPSGWINTKEDYVIRAKRTKDKGFIASGSYGGSSWNIKHEGVFMKFDSSFNYVWKSANLFNKSVASGVFELADGSFVAGGCHEDPSNEDWQVRIAKVDSMGHTLWKRTYGTPSHDYGYDMIQTQDGGYLLCGRSYFPAQNTVPLYLIKTNCMGLLTEPQANFTRTQDALTATFQNLSQYIYPDSIDGGHYLWQFGDGTTSTEINPTHTYAVAGEYSVTLTAMVCSDTNSYTEVVGVWATGASPMPPPKEGYGGCLPTLQLTKP